MSEEYPATHLDVAGEDVPTSDDSSTLDAAHNSTGGVHGHSRGATGMEHEQQQWGRGPRAPGPRLTPDVLHDLMHGPRKNSGEHPGNEIVYQTSIFGKTQLTPDQARKALREANLAPGQRSWMTMRSFGVPGAKFLGLPVTMSVVLDPNVTAQVKEQRLAEKKEALKQRNAIASLDKNTRQRMRLAQQTRNPYLQQLLLDSATARANFLVKYMHGQLESTGSALITSLHNVSMLAQRTKETPDEDLSSSAYQSRHTLLAALRALVAAELVRLEIDGIKRGSPPSLYERIFRSGSVHDGRVMNVIDSASRNSSIPTSEAFTTAQRNLRDKLSATFSRECLLRHLAATSRDPRRGPQLYRMLFTATSVTEHHPLPCPRL